MQQLRYNEKEFKKHLASGKVVKIIDTCEEQLHELFLIRNPQFKNDTSHDNEYKRFKVDVLCGSSVNNFGSWFLFEWSGLLVHYLPEQIYLELRTARNRNLIQEKEQEAFYDYNVGIAGLSIGSHAAFTIAMMGGGKNMKLADPDILSVTNLNRVRYDATQIGEKKTNLAERGILNLNPYSNIISYPDGLNDTNIEEFLIGSFRTNVLIEEVDNISLKFLLRFVAKKFRIPVIMATDNGDNVILDIERYDQEPNLPIFNGLVGDISHEDFVNIPKETLPLFVGNIVGVDMVTPRVFESLSEVGKTLYSWPQLGSAANMSGSILAYVVRQLANGTGLVSGKYDLNFEKILNSRIRDDYER